MDDSSFDELIELGRGRFYLGDWDLDIFTWVHLYLWPSLIMLDVLVVFVLYLRYLSRKEGEMANAAAAG